MGKKHDSQYANFGWLRLFKSKPELIDWRSLQNANYEKDT